MAKLVAKSNAAQLGEVMRNGQEKFYPADYPCGAGLQIAPTASGAFAAIRFQFRIFGLVQDLIFDYEHACKLKEELDRALCSVHGERSRQT